MSIAIKTKLDLSKLERRYVSDFSAASSTDMIIEGYAAVYESESEREIAYGTTYTEVIRRGAFDRTDFSKCVLRYNHEESVMALARVKNESLQLKVDNRGLFIRARIINSQIGRDLYRGVQEGLFDKMSYAYLVADGGDTYTYNDDYTRVFREIKEISKVYDVAIVDHPFYDDTELYASSLKTLEEEKRRLDGLTLAKNKLKMKMKWRTI